MNFSEDEEEYWKLYSPVQHAHEMIKNYSNAIQGIEVKVCFSFQVQHCKWSPNRKWFPTVSDPQTGGHPQPQIIPAVDRKWSRTPGMFFGSSFQFLILTETSHNWPYSIYEIENMDRVSVDVKKHQWKFGRMKNAGEHGQQASVSTAFPSPPKLSRLFL